MVRRPAAAIALAVALVALAILVAGCHGLSEDGAGGDDDGAPAAQLPPPDDGPPNGGAERESDAPEADDPPPRGRAPARERLADGAPGSAATRPEPLGGPASGEDSALPASAVDEGGPGDAGAAAPEPEPAAPQAPPRDENRSRGGAGADADAGDDTDADAGDDADADDGPDAEDTAEEEAPDETAGDGSPDGEASPSEAAPDEDASGEPPEDETPADEEASSDGAREGTSDDVATADREAADGDDGGDGDVEERVRGVTLEEGETVVLVLNLSGGFDELRSRAEVESDDAARGTLRLTGPDGETIDLAAFETAGGDGDVRLERRFAEPLAPGSYRAVLAVDEGSVHVDDFRFEAKT